ncbi:MAG: SDR family oxidoreductase [Alphaproteobacteria bacterium]|nr:SDR family oxidoreductase [Alphaproteobacteria bacterium]
MANLKGRVTLVTGGSRGIGAAIVHSLAANDAVVITCGRGARPDHLPAAVDWLSLDVSQSDQVAMIKDNIENRYGRLDGLVNNAGVQVEKTTTESSDDDWDLVMGINAKGVFLMISGHHADPSMALYNASKAFVHGLTRSIAVDHGKEGIRCNAICPGWIMTSMADAAFDLAQDPERAKTDALARHAAGRFGEPQDIANAALYLLSDDAAFVTGQTLTVDGGLVAASPLQPGLF